MGTKQEGYSSNQQSAPVSYQSGGGLSDLGLHSTIDEPINSQSNERRLSPFSLQHGWTVQWTYRVPNIVKAHMTLREEQVAKSLAKIGIIGGAQLSRLFFNKNKLQMKKMIHKGYVIPHVLRDQHKEIPIYTLSPVVLNSYGGVVWKRFTVEDVLQRMLFFQLYGKFTEKELVMIERAESEPYVGIIRRKNMRFYIGVVRGNMEEWERALRWEYESKRILLIAETLEELAPVQEMIKHRMVRVTTDHDLKMHFNEMFYQWMDGKWVREVREDHSSIQVCE
ncbi:hypothetical protein [Brevibacillus dissolubilis]|uniref:hypothetical protein n=1 Tax=Brevibacillus dissolubilis TaxID=1844116 RepID=UPI001116EA67|nr:hypothetical protein [Brevibacillus dissolubilis]